jgi:hypothetical protein
VLAVVEAVVAGVEALVAGVLAVVAVEPLVVELPPLPQAAINTPHSKPATSSDARRPIIAPPCVEKTPARGTPPPTVSVRSTEG